MYNTLPDSITRLLQGAEQGSGVLSGWYATPLTPEQAKQLLRSCERYRYSHKHLHALTRLIAKFWLNRNVNLEYQWLTSAHASLHQRVLGELIYGQLLASRRLTDAIQHLTRGFELGHPLFTPKDYFQLLRRHQLLARLPLAITPSSPESLDNLLRIAAVIQQLEPRIRGAYHHNPDDLYG